jgi:two-component system chemotaxis sensor kinase CheA
MSDKQDYPMDLEILAGFVDEAAEGICSAMDDILALGRKGYDEERVQSVFRIFHSIKGNSAFFGLFPVKDLSHSLEQVLDKLRKKDVVPDQDVVDSLLDGATVLNNCFSAVRVGGIDAICRDDVLPAIRSLHDLLERKMDITFLLHSVLDDLRLVEKKEKEPAQVIEKIMRIIEKETGETEKTGKALDASVDKQPSSYLEPLVEILAAPKKEILSDVECGEIEKLLDNMDETFADEERKNLIRDVKKDFAEYRNSVGLDPIRRQDLLDKLRLFPEGGLVKAGLREPGQEEGAHSVGKTMRVSEAAVDQFLSYVGELVVVEEMYSSLEIQMAEGEKPVQELTASLRKTTDIFKGLSRQLQQSIMEIRKVPLGNLFQRMPKIVHDVAKAKNKDIELKIENGQLMVDKNLVEKMEAPLVHMVRNAADHGIELPDVRKANGKQGKGTIHLSAEEVGETIRITVQDDGAGINLSKIREKALEMGLLDNNAVLSEDRIIDVMFRSGVSTAEEVSDISGRGVGMDVVRKNIEEAGGSIRTSTEAGKGTAFTLILPSSVTTQIIQGFIVRAGSKRCVIPLDTVGSSLSYSASKISSVKGRRKVLSHNNHLIPVSRLEDVIYPEYMENQGETDGNSGIIVITQAGSMEKAYVVDAVEGIRQVVVKPIHQVGGCESDMMMGGAVMGDGTVALILDMEKIMKMAE